MLQDIFHATKIHGFTFLGHYVLLLHNDTTITTIQNVEKIIVDMIEHKIHNVITMHYISIVKNSYILRYDLCSLYLNNALFGTFLGFQF